MENPPRYIEEMTKEITRLRDDLNNHFSDDRTWKTNHEKADHEAFTDLKDGLQGLYSANREMSKAIVKLSDNLEAYKQSNEAMVNTWKTLPVITKIVVYVASAIMGIAGVGAALLVIKSWFH